MAILTATQQSAPNLSDIIAWVESRNNPHAMRFEPTVFSRLTLGAMLPEHAAIVNRIVRIHNCSIATAQVIYSTSYGLHQVMGFNLYADESANCTDLDVVSFCVSPYEQRAVFNSFVSRETIDVTPLMLASSESARVHFGNVYNGDGEKYAPQIADALQHYAIRVL